MHISAYVDETQQIAICAFVHVFCPFVSHARPDRRNVRPHGIYNPAGSLAAHGLACRLCPRLCPMGAIGRDNRALHARQ